MDGKIAIEEHFVTPKLEDLIANPGWAPDAFRAVLDRLGDTDGGRIEAMDRHGIEMAVLSLGANGIQDEPDAGRAVERAAQANDALAAVVAARPDRYAGFAAVALQDPEAAADEAERAVRELGLRGVLVNGYSSVGDLETAAYYDEPRFEPFWGRPELLGPTWAFGVETATHALRLITSGLFDRFPRLTVILGHLGEGLRESFHITTSGNYHTPSLVGLLLELGADRVLFAADHPFEDLADGARWMDTVPIAEGDRLKIGRLNAARLLGL